MAASLALLETERLGRKETEPVREVSDWPHFGIRALTSAFFSTYLQAASFRMPCFVQGHISKLVNWWLRAHALE